MAQEKKVALLEDFKAVMRGTKWDYLFIELA